MNVILTKTKRMFGITVVLLESWRVIMIFKKRSLVFENQANSPWF